MQELIVRIVESDFFERLINFRVVAVLGAKQTGKTAFISKISDRIGAIRYFNLKKWEHLKELYVPEQVFTVDERIIFCIDNIQLAPELLPIIGTLIQLQKTQARFVIIGNMGKNAFLKKLSLSVDLVSIFSLSGLTARELFHPTDFSINRHWLRGGFPDSYFSTSDANSVAWRENYLKSFVENDHANLGIYLSGMQIYRLLNIFAQNQAQGLNTSKIAEIFQVTHPTIRRYAEMLEQSYFLHLLAPYSEKTKKRIVKTPKTYIRDSGMLHKLLSIHNMEDLRENPIRLASWKGYVIENVTSVFQEWDACFYESVSGPCLDLILIKSKQKIAIKIALSAMEITDNFWSAIRDVNPDYVYMVVASSVMLGKENENITVCELPELISFIRKIDEEI